MGKDVNARMESASERNLSNSLKPKILHIDQSQKPLETRPNGVFQQQRKNIKCFMLLTSIDQLLNLHFLEVCDIHCAIL